MDYGHRTGLCNKMFKMNDKVILSSCHCFFEFFHLSFFLENIELFCCHSSSAKAITSSMTRDDVQGQQHSKPTIKDSGSSHDNMVTITRYKDTTGSCVVDGLLSSFPTETIS